MNDVAGFSVHIRHKDGWGIVRNVPGTTALSIADREVRDGGEAKIYDSRGNQVYPRKDAQSEIPQAQKAAGYAYLGILIAILLAMTVIHLVIGDQPIASVPWLDAPVFEEAK